MNVHSESSELYQVRELYYNSKYEELINLSSDELIFDEPLNLQYFHIFKARALITLQSFDEALKLIESLDSELVGEEIEFLSGYLTFKQNGNDSKLVKLMSGLNPGESKDLSYYLVGLYLIQIKDFENSLDLLNLLPIDSDFKYYESINLLILNTLLVGDLESSQKVLKYFGEFQNNDDILFNLINSLSSLIAQGTTSNYYYQFDELSNNSNTSSFKNYSSLLLAELKLKHFPESIEIYNKIKESNYINKDNKFESLELKTDCLINLITLAVINSSSSLETIDGLDSTKLKDELVELNPNCEYLVDLKEKSDIFDSIVEKYKIK